jgi:hypothetical protein
MTPGSSHPQPRQLLRFSVSGPREHVNDVTSFTLSCSALVMN